MADEYTGFWDSVSESAARGIGLAVDLELARRYVTDDSGPTTAHNPGQQPRVNGQTNQQTVAGMTGSQLMIGGAVLAAVVVVALIAARR